MNWHRWFRGVVIVGLLLTLGYALPGIFRPLVVVEFLGAAPPTQPVWPAFGFLLTALVSMFSIPVACRPLRYRAHAVLGIVGWLTLFLFWVWLYPHRTGGPIPWIAWMDLVIGIVQMLLYSNAFRDAVISPSREPFASVETR